MDAASVPWFDSSAFMPHGHCYLWLPSVLGMHVLSDALIGLAYFAIPIALAVLLHRRRDLPFRALFISFGTFIALCGLTHWMSIWNVWHAEYWIEGVIKTMTAIASVPAAIALYRAVPAVLSLPGPSTWNAVIEDLKSSNARLEAFAATASHDLRSPLMGVRTLLDAIARTRDGSIDERTRQSLVAAARELDRMSVAIDARLRLVRAAHEPLRRRSVDVTAAATAEIARLRASDPSRAIDVVVEPGMHADADPVLLDLLLDSLIGNAWKFTSGLGTAEIRVGCRTTGDGQEFYVRDNGAGFAVDPAKLFVPMQRFHDGGAFPGTGLGLAAAKQIVERHGGSIRVNSVVGKGTVVTFSLEEPPTRVGSRIAPYAPPPTRSAVGASATSMML